MLAFITREKLLNHTEIGNMQSDYVFICPDTHHQLLTF